MADSFSSNVNAVLPSRPAFRKIGAVILLISNMERSLDFYKNTLGLPLKSSSPTWVEFFSNGTVLALHPMKNKIKQGKSKTGMLIGFMVSDIDQTCQELKKKNVKFLKEPREEKFGKHAIILDPDGYMISIAQLKSGVHEEIDLFGAIGVE